MRKIALLLIALTVQGQSVAAQTSPLPPVKVIGELPVGVDYVAPTLNGRRIYYVDGSPYELWLYDVATRRSTKVFAGDMDFPSVSAQGNRIAFTRPPEGGTTGAAIWTIPLDPGTGLATGPARRASLGNGTDQRALSPSLSPDGKWIAFASRAGRVQLVVIPSDGGNGASAAGRHEPYRRHQVVDRSAVALLAARFPASEDLTLHRIAIAGGKPEMLAQPPAGPPARPDQVGVDGWIGISADGAFHAVWALNSGLRLMDASGKVRGEIPGGADGWLSSSDLLYWESHRLSPLKSISLADGKVRDVLPAAYDIGTPAWAPDGKKFAVVSAGHRGVLRPGTNTLLMANADGSNLRTIPVPRAREGRLVWSPDGRWIAMTERVGTGITAVDVANGKTQQLRTAVHQYIADVRWTSDSKHVLYGTATKDGNPIVTRYVVRRVGLDGSDVIVTALPNGTLGRRPLDGCCGSALLAFISDTSVLVEDSSGMYVRSLTSDRFARVVSGRVFPSASPVGDLLAMTPPGWVQGDTAVRMRRSADVVTSAGVHVANVVFPNSISHGVSGSFAFTPDNKNLLTWGWNPTENRCCKLFVAPIDGGPVRTLAEFVPARNGSHPGFALSPDGKTLLFTQAENTSVTTMWSVDVSGLMRGAPKN